MAQAPPPASPMGMANTSGQGPTAVVPTEIQGWCWGGFLLGWIWCIVHKAWVGLILCLLVGIIGSIVCGVKGNEWAWQNNQYQSVAHFKEIQGKWTKWGVIILCVSVGLAILVSIISTLIAVAANQ